MAIQFNPELQKFNDFVQAMGQDENAVVQLDGNMEAKAATHTTGAFGRWLCLTGSAQDSRRANNETRMAFLRAIAQEFNGMENIPASVRKALQLKDYGLEKGPEGTTSFTSGKPLTARRISQVLAAVTAEIEAMKGQMDTIDPGQLFSRRDMVIRDVLAGNPRLVQQDGMLNFLGDIVFKAAKGQFDALLAKCNVGDKLAFLKNYSTEARKAAEFMNDIALETLKTFNGLMDTPHFDAVLHAPARNGAPADDRQVATRRHVFVEKMLDSAFQKVFISDGRYSTDVDATLANLKDWAVDQEGKPVARKSAYVFSSYESIVEILLGFEDQVAAAHPGLKIPSDILDLVKGSATEAAFNGQPVEVCAKRAKGFADMFEVAWTVSGGNNVSKAMGIFSLMVSTKIAKPVFAKGGNEMLNSLADFDLQLPATVTKDTMHTFFQRLAAKVHAKSQEIARTFDEFGAQDVQDLYTSFTMLLFVARPDVRNWLDRQDSTAIIAACSQVEDIELPDSDAVGDAEFFDCRAVQIMASTLEAVKVYAA